MRRRQRILICVFAVAVPNLSFATSYDCAKAASFIEKTICADASLSALDDKLAEVYKNAIRNSGPEVDVQELRRSQREWLKERNLCQSVACISRFYQQRISQLSPSQRQNYEAVSNASELKIRETSNVTTGSNATTDRPTLNTQALPRDTSPIVISSTENSATVAVTGFGESLTLAKEDAARQAIQLVVNSYISSDIVINNDEILVDKTVNYNSGSIESMKVISQGKGGDGLFFARVIAAVSTKNVVRKLEDINTTNENVKGDSLFASAVNKADQVDAAEIVWGRLLAKFPQAALRARLTKKPDIVVGEKSSEVKVVFNGVVEWDKDFLSELFGTLEGFGKPRKLSAYSSECLGILVDDTCFAIEDGMTQRKIIMKISEHMQPYFVRLTVLGRSGQPLASFDSSCEGRYGADTWANPFSQGFYPKNITDNSAWTLRSSHATFFTNKTLASNYEVHGERKTFEVTPIVTRDDLLSFGSVDLKVLPMGPDARECGRQKGMGLPRRI